VTLIVLGALAWVSLSVLMVAWGWKGVVLTCLVAALVCTAASTATDGVAFLRTNDETACPDRQRRRHLDAANRGGCLRSDHTSLIIGE
jgi:hypothetical protein